MSSVPWEQTNYCPELIECHLTQTQDLMNEHEHTMHQASHGQDLELNVATGALLFLVRSTNNNISELNMASGTSLCTPFQTTNYSYS